MRSHIQGCSRFRQVRQVFFFFAAGCGPTRRRTKRMPDRRRELVGGSEGMLPMEILKIRLSETAIRAF